MATLGGLAAGLALWPNCAWGALVMSTSLVRDNRRRRLAGSPGVGPIIRPSACMASQYAGWAIDPGGFFAMGSGPLRAKARVSSGNCSASWATPKRRRAACSCWKARPCPATMSPSGWRRKAGVAGRDHVCGSTNGQPGRRRADCRAGARNRAAQDGHPRLRRDARATARWAPRRFRRSREDDIRAIGRTNDCILYGGRARYVVRAEDERLADLAERLPASASTDYGTPFHDIFKRYDSDFYKIDPMLFSPAEVWLTSAITGRTFHGGRLDPDVLGASLLGD